MEEATKSAQVIRQEIQAFRNRYAFVQARDVCSICDLQLLMRPFYLFPCGHRFHSDCLLNELNPILPPGKKNKLLDLQASIQNTSDQLHCVIPVLPLRHRYQLRIKPSSHTSTSFQKKAIYWLDLEFKEKNSNLDRDLNQGL